MKITVTGASGFVGRHVVARLAKQGHVVHAPGHKAYDLTHQLGALTALEAGAPECVIHLAALVGGIGANAARPADFWRDNLLMGLNVLEACREFDVHHLVMAGTTCSYPKNAPTPFIEERLFEGYPDESNAPYGVAKLALIEGIRAYRRQYGLVSTTLVLANTYGPGDHFDLQTSHVVPAMIRKFHEARRDDSPSVMLWGDGSPTRDLLYVGDAAEAFSVAVDRGGFAEPINVGSGEEVSMSSLAELVRKIVGYQGEIVWDKSRPNGQPRRCLDVTRAYKELRWFPSMKLEDGLRATYHSFISEVIS